MTEKYRPAKAGCFIPEFSIPLSLLLIGHVPCFFDRERSLQKILFLAEDFLFLAEDLKTGPAFAPPGLVRS
jgi:hypothetical protein